MILPRYVTAFHDRHGKQRFRFRRRGYASTYLPAPTDPAFDPAYRAALKGSAGGTPSKTKGGTELSAIVSPRSGVEYVYFIGAARGPVKIGTSRNMPNRLSRLRTGSPNQLRILALAPGDEAVEQAYHARFAAFRIRGEWFRRTRELSLEIARLRRLVSNHLVELDTNPAI